MNVCRTCGQKLIERATRRTAEQLKKPYYYTAYYYCPHCRKMYHNDKFKVVNDNYELFTTHTLEPVDFDVDKTTGK